VRSVTGALSALVLVGGVMGIAPAAAAAGPACTITGTSGNDTLFGTPGRDVLCGLDGNDVLRGLQGDDLLIGGPGDDQMFGGSGRDELRGDDGFDLLRGDDGADRSYGGAGGDTFRATQGSAVGVVGDGPDLMVGGSGGDTVDYSLRTTGVRVTLDGAANDGAPGEGDRAGVRVDGVSDIEHITSGTGNDVLIGNEQGNFLVSRGGVDQITGNGGGDTIDVMDHTGDDTVRAGAGADVCVVDAGDDRTSCETVLP
jgi:Ca2+-binding RTX toxin-like protein